MKYTGSKTLETKRLLLHKTEERDLKEIWNILLLEEVSKYYLTTKINDDWEKEKVFQYKKLEKASNPDVFCWTIELKSDHSIIGQISINPTDIETIKDIGWFLDPMYQKKGYAKEAALEVLKYIFLEVGIEKIETSAAIINPNSWKLMEKLGFKRLSSTKKIKYTFCHKEVLGYQYILEKNDFLKEYFRKEKLYIEEDIDKDPYIKHISDDLVLNVTGESGSGKTTEVEKYKDDPNCIIIDTDNIFGDKNSIRNKYEEELHNFLLNKYNSIPDLCTEFDLMYSELLNYFCKYNKLLIIDSAQYRNMKDISKLKGDIIIIRTCINTCYERCIKRYEMKHANLSFEELTKYMNRKKNIYKLYHLLNDFIDRVDKYENE